MTEPDSQQPWLHEWQIAVDGPATTLADRGGDIGAPGTGLLVDDRRVLSRWRLTLDGHPVQPVAASSEGAVSQFWAAARHLGAAGPDPTVEVLRRREVTPTGIVERLQLRSRADRPLRTEVALAVAGDGADIAAVKAGRAAGPALPVTGERELSWRDERHRTVVHATPSPHQTSTLTGEGARLVWQLSVPPRGSAEIMLRVAATRSSGTDFDAGGGAAGAGWDAGSLADRVQDPTLARTLATNLADLRHLLLTDPLAPADRFAAAGSPWYLTLFGRDSLWVARMMLPLTTELAGGTLRALARRQGQADDPRRAEQPGKILHEVRRSGYDGTGLRLPALYYGTVDATPLWVVLLGEAHAAGLPADQVRALLPNLRAALGWMERAVRESPDGFLRYVDETGSGLANQGWKDSGDSMRRADGSLAPAPIALLEAQAYAVQAALVAADLLAALGEGEPDERARWRSWAADLAGRTREAFWVERGEDRYLAMALDAQSRPVDGVGSNMGHVLGTGLLPPAEAREVADRLLQPDLLGPFGIGTLSRENPAYNPMGYHSGSVWTHDTAIALLGMLREGLDEHARTVAARLLRLATATEFRFPELVGGEPVGAAAVPYPASCRPQAWSAASAAVVTLALAPEALRGAA
ncbi:amylo-alpha-1,6-glucosidase [Ornithinicoccus halotolerans]|uniref:amylo-alpha-1,6-glucosidase n=1 Tax=Ornithinicoccus halotolerans TaxID=1748220 RepID=UPI001294AEAB|nr:glycogen debranching N-terminal domain-containing protein [Ornithinicoccus halotolerans]